MAHPGGFRPLVLAPQHYKVMLHRRLRPGEGPRACTRRTRPRITIRGGGGGGAGTQSQRATHTGDSTKRGAGGGSGKTSMRKSTWRLRTAPSRGTGRSNSVGSSGTGDAGASVREPGINRNIQLPPKVPSSSRRTPERRVALGQARAREQRERVS